MGRFAELRDTLGNWFLRHPFVFGALCAFVGASLASLAWLAFDHPPHAPANVVGRDLHANARFVGEIVPELDDMVIDATPLDERSDYTVQPPDVLAVQITAAGPAASPDQTKGLSGPRLIQHDGNMRLGGEFGSLKVDGLTLREIKAAIQERVDAQRRNWRVDVSVHHQDSHVYYLITEGPGGGSVCRCPITGGETLLDALCQVKRFNELRDSRIWIARPQAGSHVDKILPVAWKWTSDQIATGTNDHLLSGDRVFIAPQFGWRDLVKTFVAVLYSPHPLTYHKYKAGQVRY